MNKQIDANVFRPDRVRLLDGPLRDAMLRTRSVLLALDPERLLRPFRLTAGLPSNAAPLGGWESPEGELRGHTLGHYLSATAWMAACTGESEFKRRIKYIVNVLAVCQAALARQASHPGYLAAFPESFFERVERREPVWAPYYTLHKILSGLLEAYRIVGNHQALEIATGIAAWVRSRVDRLTFEQMQITLLTEPGGMNAVLAELYAITRDPEHLRLSLAFNDEVVLQPLAQGEDRLDRLHANTQIPKIIGVACQYEANGDPALRALAEFFWERVALRRSYVIGGNSDDELFFPVERFDQHLSSVTAETCNTHNMLKLTQHLFSWKPSARTMDFCERALFNHILGSQDPETGRTIYFASLKPGHVKIYNTAEDSFWCCTGTGFENHARYNEVIYSHTDDALYVNLFIASELDWHERGLRVRQETLFPETETTRLILSCEGPVSLTLRVRYPTWAEGLSLTINGTPEPLTAQPGEYIALTHTWTDGDTIEIHVPMRLQLEPLPGAPDWVAVVYGPIVLAGELGHENMPDPYLKDLYTRMTPVNDWPTPPVPEFVGVPETILSGIQPVGNHPLTFQTAGIGQPCDVTLIPFFRLHHQRYTVYWHVRSADL